MSAASTIAAACAVFIAIAGCGGSEPPPKPPAPAPPPSDPAWLSGVASACAKVASCTHTGEAARLRDPGACVDWFTANPSEALQRCVTGAKGCEQVNACVYGAGDAKAVELCAKRQGVVSACDGDRLVSCGDASGAESYVVDCAKMGATCREAKSGAGIIVRSCFSPQKCPAGAPEARCDGNAVLTCRDGAMERAECKSGTKCEERKEEGEATASCELPGRRRCELLGSRRCEGDTLVECERASGGSASKPKIADCSALGLACRGVGPRAGCLVPANVECDKEMLPRCEQGKLVFCAAGRLTKLACSDLGLGPCNPGARGAMAACEDTSPATPLSK